MLQAFKKKLKNSRRLVIEEDEDDKQDERDDIPCCRLIEVNEGKVSFGAPVKCEPNNKNQCGAQAFENELKEKIDNMSRSIKSKEKKVLQACRDHNALQIRFSKQEALLVLMQEENKKLHQRVRQYEHCLDDVMRKIVNALVAEESLRAEVSVLKSRVRDLEEQNASFNMSLGQKGKDEGYCTMSSGQPQLGSNQLADLPEEPEQWLLPAEPCSTEMEDWSLSQDELGVLTFDDEEIHGEEGHWLWNNKEFLSSTHLETQAEGITRLLQDTIIYSDDEEVATKPFSKDFYKLVSGSSKSLQSHDVTVDSDDEEADAEEEADDDHRILGTKDRKRLTRNRSNISPSMSEAGLVQLVTCSSSSDSDTRSTVEICLKKDEKTTNVKDIDIVRSPVRSQIPCSSWRRSNGWKRVNSTPEQPKKPKPSRIATKASTMKSKIPPPVPRRSYTTQKSK